MEWPAHLPIVGGGGVSSRHVIFNEIFLPYANSFVKGNHLKIPIEMF